MQLQLFDPRMTPTATSEMLADAGLRSAIRTMRKDSGGTEWPFVERIGAIGDARAWAVEDCGVRYVVLAGTVFRAQDLWFCVAPVRKAAEKVFAKLDEIAAPAIEPLKPADKRIYKMVAVKDWGKNQPVMVDNIACGRRPKRKVKEKT